MTDYSQIGEQMGAETEALKVKMFGQFSMTWKGVSLTGAAKSSESQFICLMEILLHMREHGVTRDQLEQALFEDRDINDIHHALRSVIYNARKKLRACGLPESDYIVLDKGVFTWTKDIPVVEDASEMEALIKEAGEETDPVRKKKLYLDACYKYSGEFLAKQIGTIWISREARKYREMFIDCMGKAMDLLRSFADFHQMEELGRYASRLHPLENWEVVTMEALVAMNRRKEAFKLYDDTLDLYYRELGLKPSERLMEMLARIDLGRDQQFAILNEIRQELTGVPQEHGGYLVTFPVFQGICRLIARMPERSSHRLFFMLFTLVDGKGNPVKHGNIPDELSARLREAICCTVRQSDVVTRFSKGQYMVLLANISQENCQAIREGVNTRFILDGDKTDLQYCVKSVITQPQIPAPDADLKCAEEQDPAHSGHLKTDPDEDRILKVLCR